MTLARPRTLRRLLAGLVVAALGTASFGAGALASGVTRPTYPGLALVALPDMAATPQLPADVLSPILVLRQDGALVGLGPDGYTQVRLPATMTSDLFATLAAAPGWKAAYPLPGLRSTRRVELRLMGASRRTIRIDDPLQNPTLPDPLFRLVATLLRPTGLDPTAAVPLDPPALRVRTLPLASAADAAGAEAAPVWLDPPTAAGPDGQRLAGETLATARAAWPRPGVPSDQESTRIVRVDGTALRLAWGADWTDWIEGVK